MPSLPILWTILAFVVCRSCNCQVDVWRQKSNMALSPDRVLVVTSILEEPFVMLRTEPYRNVQPADLVGSLRFHGFLVELIEKLAARGNFSYVIKLVNDSAYGIADEDGRWNGMIGEIMRQEADMALAPLTVTYEREQVVDFTVCFMMTGITMVMKKPVKVAPSRLNIARPLSSGTWTCICCAYLALGVVLMLVNRFSPQRNAATDASSGAVFVHDPSGCRRLCYWLTSQLNLMNSAKSSRSGSARMVGIVGWIFTIAVVATYTASLASSLTIESMHPAERPELPIQNAEDLQKQTEVQYGMYGSGSTASFFRRSQVKLYKSMWQRMQAQPELMTSSNQAGFQRVRDSHGKYVFLAESSLADYVNRREPCDTVSVGDNLDSKGYGIAVRQDRGGNALQERLSRELHALKEDGTLAVMQQHWWSEGVMGQCATENTPHSSNRPPLRLSQVAGLFSILIVGLGLALVMVFLEWLCRAKCAPHPGDHEVSMS